jgi:hypothetical protein
MYTIYWRFRGKLYLHKRTDSQIEAAYLSRLEQYLVVVGL